MTYKPLIPVTCLECGLKAVGRRLCRKHYYKKYNEGTLNSFRLLGPNDVFLDRIEKTNSCWLWKGTKNSYGYGIFLLPGEKPVRAHRYSYEFHKGPIPDGLVVLHSCDNPLCVNPDHLSIGTRGDNNRDAKRKRRNAHGEKNGQSKLTAEMVAAILSSNEPQITLAKRYGVGQGNISRIKNNHLWKR
jgi:hypothetical protein